MLLIITANLDTLLKEDTFDNHAVSLKAKPIISGALENGAWDLLPQQSGAPF